MAVKGKLRKNPELRSQKSELGIRRGFGTNFHEFSRIITEFNGHKRHKRGFDHEGVRSFFLQDLQDDRDLGGGGRFAGVAGATSSPGEALISPPQADSIM